jgi:hypothetical protein
MPALFKEDPLQARLLGTGIERHVLSIGTHMGHSLHRSAHIQDIDLRIREKGVNGPHPEYTTKQKHRYAQTMEHGISSPR